MQKLTRTLLAMSAVALAAGTTTAQAAAATTAESIGRVPQQEIESLYMQPGHFSITSNADHELVNFNEERDARVCVKQAPHMVPLRVKFDGKANIVYPGDCFSFEAKKVVVSAAKQLQPGWDITGTFEIAKRHDQG